jgi:hypothetical protein
MIQYWVLTFNRPKSLNRVISNLGLQGAKVNVLNNAPPSNIHIDSGNCYHLDQVVQNQVNTIEATSWCARSWNTIYLKALNQGDQIVCLQDDTDVGPHFVPWIEAFSQNYDFIFGPAGDQFHYITKSVIQKVGWWDEKFNACYCADADYLRRVMHHYDTNRVSVEETHGWGFYHNPSGIAANIIARTPHNVVDPDYKNQHTHLDEIAGGFNKIQDRHTTNYVVEQARHNYETKWGVPLDDNRPCAAGGSMMPLTMEYDWYPWASKKHGITFYRDLMQSYSMTSI